MSALTETPNPDAIRPTGMCGSSTKCETCPSDFLCFMKAKKEQEMIRARDADLDAAILAGQIAVRDMPFDWYCPRDPERPRYECRECVAEIAVRAVYARLAERAR